VVRQAFLSTAALKSTLLGARVGVAGLGRGGALALLAACRIPGLAACVPFGGLPERGHADYSALRAAVQGHFGRADAGCTPERVDLLEAELRRLGARAEVHRYAAGPGFLEALLAGGAAGGAAGDVAGGAEGPRPEAGDAEAAGLAFRRAVAFLHAELG
jgi:carboxymethylenebutenolidase